MPKISVILPTNRINREVFPKIKTIQDALMKYKFDETLTKEFIELISWRALDINHYLELTLNSLSCQTFKDFEVIISHKYPEDAIDAVKGYDMPIKLVAEKHSPWHDLGYRYPTLNSNINTAIIHSSGELLWRLDDLTFFNNDIMQELWNKWKDGYYSTSRGFRCIEFRENDKNKEEVERVGLGKYDVYKSGWFGQFKPLTGNGNRIAKWMCWGFSSTIGIEDFLEINGQDEAFDGAICGTDMDLGMRLSVISKYERLATDNLVYEVNDVPYKYQTRDDTVFRQIINRTDYRANCWKPTENQIKRYEMWHKKNVGELDPNWNRFLNVTYIDMKSEYKSKKLGEVVYES